MAGPRGLPCGSWPSPITSEAIVTSVVRLGELRLDGDDLYWLEGRPEDGGRQVLVRRDRDGVHRDVVGAPFNVRCRVQEYGGSPYIVDAGTVWFGDFGSGRLHRVDPGGSAVAMTPEGDLRYADFCVDRRRGRLLCVLEDHTTGAAEAVNSIAEVPFDGGAPRIVAGGHDFAAAPRLSPDGERLAWLVWDHPRLPWDGTELWVAELDGAGRPRNARRVAGGERESIADPLWAPDGSLWFSSDRDRGWWNLHRWDGERVLAVSPMEAETAIPAWTLGYQRFALLDDGRAITVAIGGGRERVLLVDAATGSAREVPLPFTTFGSMLRVRGGHLFTTAASPHQGTTVIDVDLARATFTELRRASSLVFDPEYVSTAEHIEFPTAGGLTAHAYYYPPRNRDARAEDGERPPLRVLSHGGPTSAAETSLDPSIQYFTSRGFAVVDVDYGGSTGYGRAYRERLYGRWGVVDVEDCVAAVHFLAARGDIDERRVCIQGGSAGGYTTLQALTSTDAFAAGCSLFGIGDLRVFVRDTHKFESRYMDQLVGPFPACAELYDERSPVNHTDRLTCPVILFQGLEDAVVPPNQAVLFFDAAKRRGIPCAYEPFEGEQHGFRIAANIRRCLDGELSFYGHVFDFEPDVWLDPPLRIYNAEQ